MDDLDAAIALVYAQPPSGFVAARSALVKELKGAKRKDDAAAVAALRRPTKLAWAVGEAVRRAPEAAEAFLAAVGALAEPGGDLRQRTNDLRQAVAALMQGVEGVDPGDATAALLAVAADGEATEALRLGRLADVPAGGGFGGLAMGAAPAPPREAAPTTSRQQGPSEAAEDGGGEAASAEAEAAADAAAARRREEQARERAERIAALEAERDEAARAEEAAASRVEAAQGAVEAAQAELAEARAALEERRAALAVLEERVQEAEAAARGS